MSSGRRSQQLLGLDSSNWVVIAAVLLIAVALAVYYWLSTTI